MVLGRGGDKHRGILRLVRAVSHKYSKSIAVQLMVFTKFWQAEEYHQDYIQHNPDGGYVQNVSIPEIRKFQKEYPEMIKPGHVF